MVSEDVTCGVVVLALGFCPEAQGDLGEAVH